MVYMLSRNLVLASLIGVALWADITIYVLDYVCVGISFDHYFLVETSYT